MVNVRTIIVAAALCIACATIFVINTGSASAAATKTLGVFSWGVVQAGSSFKATGNPVIIAVNIVRALLGIVGFIFVALFVYAGARWMFSQGDSGVIEEAKNTMKNAALGFIVIAVSYSFWIFVQSQAEKAAGVQSNLPQQNP